MRDGFGMLFSLFLVLHGDIAPRLIFQVLTLQAVYEERERERERE